MTKLISIFQSEKSIYRLEDHLGFSNCRVGNYKINRIEKENPEKEIILPDFPIYLNCIENSKSEGISSNYVLNLIENSPGEAFNYLRKNFCLEICEEYKDLQSRLNFMAGGNIFWIDKKENAVYSSGIITEIKLDLRYTLEFVRNASLRLEGHFSRRRG